MDQVALAEHSYGVAGRVIAGVRPEQLDAPTPCEQWEVRDLVNHIIGAHFSFTGALHGQPSDPHGRPPDFTEDASGTFDRSSKAMLEAWREPGALDRNVETKTGTMPGSMLIGMHTMDNLVHSWDLARATGQSEDLDPELATQMLAMMREANPPRGKGAAFAPEQPAPADATPEQQLAAYLGRTV
jgi:uncharacterized protein (TIGR03086 family)